MMRLADRGSMLSPEIILDRGRNPDTRIGIGAKVDKDKVERTVSTANRKGLGHTTIYVDPAELVKALSDGDIDAAVRGSLDSTTSMNAIKETFSVDRILRIALLQPPRGRMFFFAPVGVDEGWTVEQKMEFIDLGVKLMRKIGVEPKIGVLSGGRLGDKGRHPGVDRTLSDAEEVTRRGVAAGLDIRNCEILIENAVIDRNLILAPDGISGNLIFRTLHFLGRGKALGAVVLNIDRVFVDTSRAKSSYIDSIALASALVGRRKA